MHFLARGLLFYSALVSGEFRRGYADGYIKRPWPSQSSHDPCNGSTEYDNGFMAGARDLCWSDRRSYGH
jgi:hypothetical protein